MTHHIWGIENGLPDELILAIAQTPDGYLWLGTPRGLVRFDGFKFVDLEADIAPALQEFGVSCILVGSDGSLWAGSVGGGVTHLSGGSAIQYGTDRGFQALSIRTLFQSLDGTIWAGTDRGLYKLEKGKFVPVEELGKQWITSIVSDGGDGFWIAGMNLLHYQHGEFLDVPLPALSGPIRTLAKSHDGTLWLGADDGLLERKPDGRIHFVRQVRASVRALYLDTAGKLWIGTIGSGLLMRQSNGEIVQPLNAEEPASKAIRAIARTKSGDFWFGTDEGLIRLSATGMDFVRIPSAAATDFATVFVDHDSSVWLSAGELTRYTSGILRPALPSVLGNRSVRAVYRERGGALWVGTLKNGAYRIVNGAIDAHFVSGLRSHAVTGFMQAPDGTVWIGTDGGLVKWAHGKFTSYEKSDEYPYGVGTVRSMALAPDGSVWIGTPSGLYLFQHGSYVKTDIARRLARFSISSICAEPDGGLWIGAGTGLYYWRNGVLSHIQLPEPSSRSQAVVSILIDTNNRFLIALRSIIYRVSRNALERSVSAAQKKGDGIVEVQLLSQPEIFAVARENGAELSSNLPRIGAADNSGGAWYASYQGIVHIAAESISRQEVAPPVVIERVVVDGIPMLGRDLIHLAPSVHNIEIQATPILLSAGTGLEFRRRLIGLEDNWTHLMPGSSTSYGKLAPGQYKFRVEANWPGGDQISSAEIVLVQESAIYRRKSFIAACCLAIALLAWLLYRFRMHQVKLRFQAVVGERNRVAREIHDTLLQGCIGAAALLEALEISHEQAASSQDQRRRALLKYVREAIGETIKEAREAIWNLRNPDDQKPLGEALRDVLERLTSHGKAQTSFAQKGEAIRLVPRVQHEILMATREAILNAVTHAHPKTVEVQIEWNHDDIAVTISDDGCGFDPQIAQVPASEHFGVSGMSDRMRKFGGTMHIDSQVGSGTNVRLKVPLDASILHLNEKVEV